ncbi:MAG: GNAT family N-acetyltransferase [Paracoccaceae bacterium]
MTRAAIRRLTRADVDAFRALRLDALAREPVAFGAAHEEEAQEPPSFFEARLDSLVFGAEADGRLLAIGGLGAGGRLKTRHRATLWGLYVAPEARGHGIGGRLVAALVEAGRAMPGVETLVLTVTAGNAAALALYRAAGFEAVGVDRGALRVGGVDHDEVLMRLDLGP